MRPLSLLIVLLAAACAGKDTAPPAAAPGASTIESATFAASLNVDLAASTKTASGLYYRDLTTGGGPEVLKGQRVSVHYAGWLPDGTPFDQNEVGQPPFTFTVGQGEVITGWDEGVAGMRVGGKRQLILPAALGYGAGGSGPIPPNAILVFTVDVVGVQ